MMDEVQTPVVQSTTANSPGEYFLKCQQSLCRLRTKSIDAIFRPIMTTKALTTRSLRCQNYASDQRFAAA